MMMMMMMMMKMNLENGACHMVLSCPLWEMCAVVFVRQTFVVERVCTGPEAPVHGHKHARQTRSQQHITHRSKSDTLCLTK